MRRGLILSVVLLAAVRLPLRAHEIPNDVTIQGFVKPEGPLLHLLLRVPLRAMRDINYPSRVPGQLDLDQADEVLRDAATLWLADNVAVFEGEARRHRTSALEVRASLPADRSFATYGEARAHLSAPRLPGSTALAWNEGWLDVGFDYPIDSDRADFAIDTSFARLGVHTITVLRFLPPGGGVRAFEYPGDAGLVWLDPRWHQTARRFVALGFRHFLGGANHLLFLFCLVLPGRRWRALVPVVAAFTVAHSVTLIASAFDMATGAPWFPPLIECLLALSIVYIALENIAVPSPRWRPAAAFGFGLIHGFGFSFALREAQQFAGSHVLTSLLSFNVGIELGQLCFLVLLIPAIDWIFRVIVAERTGAIILSALVAHTGWHWLLDRWDRLRQYRVEWPDLTPALMAAAMRWVMVAVTMAAIAWLVLLVRRKIRPRVRLTSLGDSYGGPPTRLR